MQLLSLKLLNNAYHRIFDWFWKGFDRHCRHLIQKAGTVPPFKGEHGFYYPDPQEMADYIRSLNLTEIKTE